MKLVALTVNGTRVAETIEPRTHLADLLRDQLGFTGTHLRCEQGACGACTLLIDGHPARSCITYAILCEDAEVTTIEGLEDDPVMIALRRAFSAEHGLQCGFCTPAMLITARDIVMRLPDADERRIRHELSGNLCRCTGYGGIVRAIRNVLEERQRGTLTAPAVAARTLGPVGSRHAQPIAGTSLSRAALGTEAGASPTFDDTVLGLGGRKPNIEIRRSFVIARPPSEVWHFFGDIERVVPCLPGATLTGTSGDRVLGKVTVRLGPVTASFNGEARIVRDEATQRGTILGAGSDQLSASRANAEVEYAVAAEPADAAASHVDIIIRAILLGPLAQFGRSTIVNDLASRLTEMFASNLERRLAGDPDVASEPGSIALGSLLRAVITSRINSMLTRIRSLLRS